MLQYLLHYSDKFNAYYKKLLNIDLTKFDGQFNCLIIDSLKKNEISHTEMG